MRLHRSMVSGMVSDILALAFLIMPVSNGVSQITNVVDQFNPSGANGFSYSGGQIGKVWTNWFGTAFQSDVWDSTSDANSNVASGILKITANFNGSANQFEVYDGPKRHQSSDKRDALYQFSM